MRTLFFPRRNAPLCVALAAIVIASPVLGSDWGDVPIADAHVHLFDFLQNGDHLEDGRIVPKRVGAALQSGERGKRIEALLWAMDRGTDNQKTCSIKKEL